MVEKMTLAPAGPHERQAADSVGDASEERMRRALEQLGSGSSHSSGQQASGQQGSGQQGSGQRAASRRPARPQPEPQQASRKHRFVQDGEVQVVHVQGRRERAQRTAAQQLFPALAAEARQAPAPAEQQDGLAEEQGRRERTDRALQESQAQAAALQTKLAHAELALDEARARHQADAETIESLLGRINKQEARSASLSSELDEARQQIKNLEAELLEERQARAAAPVGKLRTTPARPRALAKSTRSVAKAEKLRTEDEPEPEPVKWWLGKKD